MKNVLGACLLLLGASVGAQTNDNFTRTEDVIYGRKFGTALTLDVIQPQPANGVGILHMVSGGWVSAHEFINANYLKPLLKRGYTVFAVVHGSQPKFVITEIVPDIHRAVRFIRHNAARYGVDPNRLGITGGSAGGHLSLTMATQGGPGDPQARDPVDSESSAVQGVACFFPPTDFLNYSRPGEDAVGVGVLKDFKAAFGPRADTAEERQLGRDFAHLFSSTQHAARSIITAMPTSSCFYQSQTFVQRCREAAWCPVGGWGKLHGWPDSSRDIELFAEWLDEHLRGLKPKPRGN